MTRYLLFIGLLTPQLWAQPVVRNFATTNEPSALTNIITALAPTFVQTNISYTAVTNAPWITNAPAQTNISVAAVTNAGTLAYSNATSVVVATNGYGTNTTLSGLAIEGVDGSGTMNVGRFSTYGIHPYFNHIQYKGSQLGGHIFYGNDGYPNFTVDWDNGAGVVETVPRSYWNKSIQPDGASVNAMFPAAGGSASALQDLPTRGNEIWQNQKLPALVITSRGNGSEGNNLANCTESNMKASVARFTTNGLAQIFTNAGIRLVYECENGWLTNHRAANGLLQWNTNRWPMQAASLTNVAWFLRTNQFEPWLMLYADSVVAPTNNTEVSIDPVVGSSSAYWFYPANSTPFAGGTESQPVMTPRDILLDISSFYAWGFRGLTVQDNKNLEKAGSQEQLRRMLAYAALYPVQISDRSLGIQSQRTYRDWYPAHEHGLVINHLFGEHTTSGATPFPPSAEFDANGLALETGGDSPNFTSAVLSYVMGALRPHLPALTNFLAKSVFYIPQSDTLTMSTTWTAADWQHYFELCAMFQCNAWLTSPHYYFTNSAFQSAATNAQMLAIWQDAARERVGYTGFGSATNNAVFARKLSDGCAVWLVNEGPVATNLVFSVTNLGFSAGMAVPVTNVWTGAYLSNATTLTVSVAATNAVFLRIGGSQFLAATNTPSTAGGQLMQVAGADRYWSSNVWVSGNITNSGITTLSNDIVLVGAASDITMGGGNITGVGNLAVSGVITNAATTNSYVTISAPGANNFSEPAGTVLSLVGSGSQKVTALSFWGSSANWYIGNSHYNAVRPGGLMFREGNITRMVIADSTGGNAQRGMVGINTGTSSPRTHLDVNGSVTISTNLFVTEASYFTNSVTTTTGGITNLSSQPMVSAGGMIATGNSSNAPFLFSTNSVLLSTITPGAIEYVASNRAFYATTWLVRRSEVLAQSVVWTNAALNPIQVVTNSSAETILMTVPMATNFVVAGKAWNIRAAGRHWSGNGDGFVLRFYLGGSQPTNLLYALASPTSGVKSGQAWKLDSMLTAAASDGTNTSFVANGDVLVNGTSTQSAADAVSLNTLNSTNAMFITISNTATASTSTSIRQGWVLCVDQVPGQ